MQQNAKGQAFFELKADLCLTLIFTLVNYSWVNKLHDKRPYITKYQKKYYVLKCAWNEIASSLKMIV